MKLEGYRNDKWHQGKRGFIFFFFSEEEGVFFSPEVFLERMSTTIENLWLTLCLKGMRGCKRFLYVFLSFFFQSRIRLRISRCRKGWIQFPCLKKKRSANFWLYFPPLFFFFFFFFKFKLTFVYKEEWTRIFRVIKLNFCGNSWERFR